MSATATSHPSPVVQAALEAAAAWVDEEGGVLARAVGAVGRTSRRMVTPLLDSAAVQGVVGRVTVELGGRLQTVVADVEVDQGSDDVVGDLGAGDRRADRVLADHRRLLVVRGAAAGAASVNLPMAAAAVVTDVFGSTMGLVRVAAEVLAGYGEDQAGLVGASLAVVDLAGETNADVRRRRLRTVVEHARGIDEHDVAGVLSDQVGTRLVNEALESVVRRRTRHALVRTAPVVGAAVGGVTAGVQVTRTVEAARHVGRLRRIERDAPAVAMTAI